MKTVVLQIGNTDDKLTQREWADFVHQIDRAIELCMCTTHFRGGSANEMPWQNFCWVIQIPQSEPAGRRYDELYRLVKMARHDYRQDSVAWTEGDTRFI